MDGLYLSDGPDPDRAVTFLHGGGIERSRATIAVAILEVLLDHGRDAGRRRIIEDGQQIDLEVEPVFEASDDLSAHQGVTTKFEEVVSLADAVEFEQIFEDRDDGSFDGSGSSWLNVANERSPGRRKLVAVELTVRRHGQRIHLHEGRRDHVLRQPRREVGTKLATIKECDTRGNHIRDDLEVAVIALPGDDRTPAHGGMGRQHGTDLVELDPLSADLNLGVNAAEEVHLAFESDSDEVAGAEETRIGLWQ